MDPDTAGRIAEVGASEPPERRDVPRAPVMDQVSGQIVRLVPGEPDGDGWAVVTAIGSDEPPEGYEWTRAAAILVGDVLYVVGGAINVQRKSVATVTRRFEAFAVRRVLHTSEAGRQSAEWTFAADDATLLLDEWLDHQGRPTTPQIERVRSLGSSRAAPDGPSGPTPSHGVRLAAPPRVGRPR
ncbi:MAG TPA: hypothetical protein VHZ31_09990 [Solirubrobacteraceae bacterium]|jgi:hypothetical protein|nr:hypothetical protein [Solirubrobacteraceae bacterium]